MVIAAGVQSLFFGNQLNQRGASYADGTRTPWVYTSTLRQRARGAATDPGTPTVLAIPPLDPNWTAMHLPKTPVYGVNFTMGLNPKVIVWEQPKRRIEKQTMEGSVFAHFTNQAGSNEGVLVLQVSGNSGNLDLRGAALSSVEAKDNFSGNLENDPGAVRNLLAFMNLYTLTKEPILLPDGTENIVTITYTSLLLQQEVLFHGHFNEVLRFEERAGEKTHSRDYNYSFTVTGTDPPLFFLLDLITQAVQSLQLGVDINATLAGSNVTLGTP